MNAFPMEGWVRVHKTVQTPLDHSSAAASRDMLLLYMAAMVIVYAISNMNDVLFLYRHQ